MAIIIAINNNKGGVLKTTIATNIAGVLSTQGKKVLIIDTDNQGNVALSFGINPDTINYSLHDVLVDNLAAEMAIINVYEDKKTNGSIDILPSNDELTFFDFDIIGNQKKYKRPFYLLRDNCKHLEKHYDYIIIDTPPSLSLMVGNVLCIADSVLIPFQPESYSMRSLTKVLEAIKQFKDNHNNKLEVLGVVGTMVDTRTVLHSEILQNTRKYCLDNGIKMFDESINKSVRYASSVAYDSLPLTLSDSKNKAAQTYNNLVEEMFNNVK